MRHDPFQISMETLIAASPLLGHALEARAQIRNAQDPALVRRWQDASTVPLRNAAQQDLFCVAPLDLLVTEADGEKQFHLLELNGTGIGGLTNLTADAVAPILDGLRQMAAAQVGAPPSGGGPPQPQLQGPDPLILVASSGKESEESPRLNRLIYEKLLYAEALKRGFDSAGQPSTLAVMPQLLRDPAALPDRGPAVVVGYIKEFLDALRVDADGRLSLFGRTVTGAVNDRFGLNVINQFEGLVDLSRLAIMNRCFLAGADKGVAYDLLNDYLQANAVPYFPSRVDFALTSCREELVATVLDWRRRGLRPVIKPHGTGLGHGIEFFLSPQEPEWAVLERIDRSIRLTQEYYRAAGGAFPYTVCEYVDACKVPCSGHPLFGHKYELRVVVYRDGMALRAFPSIIKVACEPFDPLGSDTAGLINNITASCMRTQAKGTDYMFPLSNRDTLSLFGLEDRHLTALCAAATGYVRYVLDQVQDQPQRLGLPAQQQAPWHLSPAA